MDAEGPSLTAIRVRLIQDLLATRVGTAITPPRIAVTGRTGSGKSTLGNLLAGIGHVLKSDGQLDCTGEVNVIRFPQGLEYIDLPGAAGDEGFENSNRAALALPQNPRWPMSDSVDVQVHELSAANGTRQSSTVRRLVQPVEHFTRDLWLPDVIVYLVAPHQRFDRAESAYLRDLVGRHGSGRVVHAMNIFTDTEVGAVVLPTPANVKDSLRLIATAHREADGLFDESAVVEVDCLTGDGVDELLARVGSVIGGDRGQLLAELLGTQQREAVEMLLGQWREFIGRRLAALASVVPEGQTAVADLLRTEVSQCLQPILGLKAQDGIVSADAAAAFVASQIRSDVLEPIVEDVPEDIFRTVDVYETIDETDYSNPIYRHEDVYGYESYDASIDDVDDFFSAFGSFLSGDGFAVRRRRRVVVDRKQHLVGYGRTSRQVKVGERQEFSHTESVKKQVGERVVDVVFGRIGLPGIAAVIALLEAELRSRLELKSNHVDGVQCTEIQELAASYGLTGEDDSAEQVIGFFEVMSFIVDESASALVQASQGRL